MAQLDFSDLGGTTQGSLNFDDLQGSTTPGGISLDPININETLPDVPPEIAEEAMREDFTLTNDLRGRGFNIPDDTLAIPSARDMISAELLQAQKEASALDEERIENVLLELVPNYAGSKVDPGILGGLDKDTLARMPQFKQRQSWFKNKFPEGELFRVNTGGNNLVEMYKTSPEGKSFRVSDDVFSLADIGTGTGSLVNFTTAGSVLGSIYSPFLGTTGGAYVGNTIDTMIANYLASPDGTYFSDENDFKTKFLAGDRVALALVDGSLTKILPGAGRGGKYLINKGMGALERIGSKEGDTVLFGNQPNTSLLYELGVFSVSPKALSAQKAAASIASETGVNLPALNVSQLSDSSLLRGVASQISGTADKLPQNLSNQQAKLLEALNVKVKQLGGKFETLSQDELYNYIALSNKKLADNIYQGFRARSGGTEVLPDAADGAASIMQGARDLDRALAGAIDRKYKEAFTLAGTDNVVFDISDVVKVAEKIKLGTQITKVPEAGRTPTGIPLKTDKGRKVFAAEETVRTKAFGGELQTLVTNITKVFDPSIKNVDLKSIKGSSSPELVSSFKQLKDIRDQAQDLLNSGGGTGAEMQGARELVDSIDNLIVNGIETGKVTGGTDAWRKSFLEAGSLVKQRSDIKNFTSISQMFGRSGEVTPVKVAQNLLDGALDFENYGLLRNMVNTTALTQAEKEAGQVLLKDISDTFVSLLIKNPDKGYKLIDDFKTNDSELYGTIFDSQTKSQLDDWLVFGRNIAADPVQNGLDGFLSNGAQALRYVRSQYGVKQDIGLQQFIDANGGLSGQRAKEIRGALLKDIADSSSIVNREGSSKYFTETVIDPIKLSNELDQLLNTTGKYEAFKGLFGTVQADGSVVKTAAGEANRKIFENFKKYGAFLGNTPDVGGAFATGNIRSELLSATGIPNAAKSLFTNRFLAAVFAAEPSVAQLERAINIKGSAGRVAASISLLRRMTDSLNLDVEGGAIVQEAPAGQETPSEEIDRTDSLNMGVPLNVSSNMVTTPAPTQLASAPPIQPPPRASQGAGITNFSSLFPRDELGGAIANRRNQGIMGLA